MNKLTRWNPLKESENWTIDLRRPLQEMQSRFEQLFGKVAGKEAMTLAEWTPLVDITEDEKEYLVKAELPEVKKEDIKVCVQDSTLSITGERKSEKEEKGRKFHRIERSYGRFERSFTLPDDTDPAKVTSEFADGVLKVHLAKTTEAKPQATEIPVA